MRPWHRPFSVSKLRIILIFLTLAPAFPFLAKTTEIALQEGSQPPGDVVGEVLNLNMPLVTGDYVVTQGVGETYQAADGHTVLHLGADLKVFSYRSEGEKHRRLWGTPVYAVARGRVVDRRYSEPSKDDGIGNYLMIEHDGEVVSAYLHLARVFVQVGDEVREGSVIGEAGDLGLHNRQKEPPSSPHLHFEIRKNGASKLTVSPNQRIAYVSKDGKTRIDVTENGKSKIESELPEGGVREWIAQNFLDPIVALQIRMPGKMILAGFQTKDGERFDLVPFARVSAGTFTSVSQDIERDLGISFGAGDFLTAGGFNPESPAVLQAKRHSRIQPGDWFRVYRRGNIVGYFQVKDLDLSFEGGLKLVGVGEPVGFQLNLDSYSGLLAVPWVPPAQQGFYHPNGIPKDLQNELERRAEDLLPSSLPRHRALGTLGGQRLRVRSTRFRGDGTVFDLDRDGQPEYAGVVSVQLEPADAILWATVFQIVESGEEGELGKTLLSSVVVDKDDVTRVFGSGSYGFFGILDVTGDGVAELFVTEGFYEAANLKIFDYRSGELGEICTTHSYFGH